MKKHVFLKSCLVVTVFGILSVSCSHDKANVANVAAERDSAVQISKEKEAELLQLNSFVSEIANGLDSISAQENILMSNKSRDGVTLSKDQIRKNLQFLEDLLARQRNKIQSLQDSLATQKKGSLANLKSIVAYLNRQLDEKNEEIKQLHKDIDSKNKDISDLRTSLLAMNTRAEKAERKSQKLTETVSMMDELANECYIKVGTKKELHSLGLLKGGFLAKKKVDYDKINKSQLNTVDARKFRQIVLKSDNPKVLTPQSTKAYTITSNGNGTSILRVTNPTEFWNVSNILIIQL